MVPCIFASGHIGEARIPAIKSRPEKTASEQMHRAKHASPALPPFEALSVLLVAEDDELNDLVFISGKIKSEDQGVRQTPLVERAVNVSSNDAVLVIFDGLDHRKCQLIVDNFASRPVSDGRASPKLAKLVIYQRIAGKGFHKPFKVEGVDRSYEGRNGGRERGSLQFEGFNRPTGRFQHDTSLVRLSAPERPGIIGNHRSIAGSCRVIRCEKLQRLVADAFTCAIQPCKPLHIVQLPPGLP
jgi:hypothetical protein